ncbi:PR domain zinc finger protein 10-like isoform X3 [Clavelina lepadiformis]|uniref:PR domain zinc finger protein 10-like isoform X3 n=1 Tax=Clavelina lepadiformis TaxID=159417 RepID=UPI0040421773
MTLSSRMESTNLMVIKEDIDGEEPLYKVNDTEVKSKAQSTLPDILYTFTSAGHLQEGVFAKSAIPHRTRFGPLDAPMVSLESAKSSPFLLKTLVERLTTRKSNSASSQLYFDTSKEQFCNWMCMVRPATYYEEQNMVAHFAKDNIYFTTSRNIEAHEQLKVWYAPKYAQYMGKHIFVPSSHAVPTKESDEALAESSHARPRRTRKAPRGLTYVEYFEEDDADVRSVPPKKRGWKRANRQLTSKKTSNEVQLVSENNASTLVKVNNSSYIFDEVTFIYRKVATNNDFHWPQEAMNGNSTSDLQILLNGKEQMKITSALPRVFPCPVCGKKFAKKYTLKLHCTVHSDVFNFLCQSCGKGFKRKDKLNDHIKRMHVERKDRPRVQKQKQPFVPRYKPEEVSNFLFKCLQCSVGFRRRGMLVNHILKRHPDVEITSVPELALPILKHLVTYMCPYCSNSYKSNNKRKLHIEKHHPGESVPPGMRYLKKIQEKSTYEKEAGIATSKIVAHEPVACPFCLSQYSSRCKMLKHVHSKHPEDAHKLPKKEKEKVERRLNKRKKKEPQLTIHNAMERQGSGDISRARIVSDQENTDLPNVDKIITILSSVPTNADLGVDTAENTRSCVQPTCQTPYLENIPSNLQYQQDNILAMDPSVSEQCNINESNVFQANAALGYISDRTSNEQADESNQVQEILIELSTSDVSEHIRLNTIQDPMQTVQITNSSVHNEHLRKGLKTNATDHLPKLQQQCARQLPMTYRGRKQFLLKHSAFNRLHEENPSRYISPSSISVQPSNQLITMQHPVNNHQPPRAISQNDQRFDMNAATDTSKTTTNVHSLRPCDINWI